MADVLPGVAGPAVIGLGLGLSVAGFVTGLLWLRPGGAALDRRLFARVNSPDHWPVLDSAWVVVRPLGRTWFLVLAVALGLLVGGPEWLAVAGGALVLTVLEPALKRLVGRRRPFLDLAEAVVRLLHSPSDPSYPSADAARVGFLAAAASLAAAMPGWAAIPVFALAVLVAAGRVRAGVHYCSDVWAGLWIGIGLGLVSAGAMPTFARLVN